MIKRIIVAGAFGSLAVAPLAAQDSHGVYLGMGQNNAPVENTNMPWSVGGVFHRTPGFFGVDISGEGDRLDHRGSSRSFRQGYAFNALVGIRAFERDRLRVDVAGLIGARSGTSACGKSHPGCDRCADQPPEGGYTVNFGAAVSVSYFNGLMAILRYTEMSSQLALGYRWD